MEDIRISSDDFTTVGETAAGGTSLAITGKPTGTYTYRIAGPFNNPLTTGTTITGPYSDLRCVTVETRRNIISRTRGDDRIAEAAPLTPPIPRRPETRALSAALRSD